MPQMIDRERLDRAAENALGWGPGCQAFADLTKIADAYDELQVEPPDTDDRQS